MLWERLDALDIIIVPTQHYAIQRLHHSFEHDVDELNHRVSRSILNVDSDDGQFSIGTVGMKSLQLGNLKNKSVNI